MHSRRLKKCLDKQTFISALRDWIKYLDEQKPVGWVTFSYNGGREKTRQEVEKILELC